MKNNKTITDTGIILIGHGSKAAEALEILVNVRLKLEKAFPVPMRMASLQHNRPFFSDAVIELVIEGIKKIVVVPFFLYPGNHVISDIPEIINDEKKKHPDIEFYLAGHLGADRRIVEVVIDRIADALEKLNLSTDKYVPLTDPRDIEKESYRIILNRLPVLKNGDFTNKVKSRIIHAGGDFSIAGDILFSNSAAKVVDAVMMGNPVICDVEMVRAGLRKKLLDFFSCPVECFIGDQDVIETAKSTSSTRAAVSMEKACGLYPNGIFVIGNAPSALFKIIELTQKRRLEPAAVIGMPVGFVGAEEAKKKLMRLGIPWITIKGTRGGSSFAAAALNACVTEAFELNSDKTERREGIEPSIELN